MSKDQRLFIRISKEEKRKFERVTRQKKGLSWFFLKAGRQVIRHADLIEAAEKRYMAGEKPSSLKLRGIV